MARAILALTLALLLAASIAACGSSSTEDSATTPAPAETTAAPEPAASETATGGIADEAAQLYADNCSGCHGADGAGGSAPGIAGEDDMAEIQRWIEQGGEGMPGYADQLPPGEIEAIAQFVAGGLQ